LRRRQRCGRLRYSFEEGEIVAKVLISARRSNGVIPFLMIRRDMHD